MEEKAPMTPVRASDLVVGEKIPWPIYDRYGWLLLRADSVVETQRQKDILVEAGFRERAPGEPDSPSGPVRHRPRAPERDPNPFTLFNRITLRLEECLRLVTAREAHALRLLTALGTTVHHLIDQDADAALGAVHLAHSLPYSVRHPVQKAIICETIARTLDYDAERRASIVHAALTANLGMIEIQEDLEQQTSPLTREQMAAIHAHPEQSRLRLEAAGVTDTVWLDIISQHHEKLDGTGYPNGLKGDEILPEARLVALADVYSAMITPRHYRASVDARQAMRDIFLARGREYDREMAEIFIKVLGIFPPGLYVKLSSGEVAVVVRRGADAKYPRVAAVVKRGGEPYVNPRLIETAPGGPTITGLEEREYRAWHLELPTIWGYD